MKKIIVFLFVGIIAGLCFNDNKKELLTNNAIRFRIIANSNSYSDQLIKNDIRKELFSSIEKIEKESDNINSTRKAINNYMPEIKQTMDTLNIPYNINYGMNQFPEKEYSGYTFPQKEYESLVITIGDGLGDNWWCILFPPLCLIEAEKEDLNNVEYDFYINKILNNFN